MDLMQSLTGSAEDSTTAQLTQRILEDTGYLARLRADPSAEALARIENLEELMNAIEDHGERSGDFGLGSYLEQVTLVADIDQAEMGTEDDDRLVMMSTHTAKGLEFDAVFLTGLEHGLFPHFNAIEEVGGVEEERRLAYVAMTRARDRLYLTRAESRRRFGTLQHAIASPFLEGLPSEAIRLDGPTRGQASWSRPQAKSSGLAWSRRPVAPSEEEASDGYDQVMPDYESMSQDPQGMGLGATVFHASFGEGVIIGVDGQGPRAVARVRFGDNKVKRIMARFLTLSF